MPVEQIRFSGDAWLTFVDNVTTSIQKVTGVDARTRYAKDIQVLRDRVDSLLRQVRNYELPTSSYPHTRVECSAQGRASAA